MRPYLINGALLVLCAATIAPPHARADVIMPSKYALVEGPSDNCWPLTCDTPEGASGPLLEYQQIYASSAFAADLLISAMAFRPDGLFGSAFTAAFDDVVIQLGTTSIDPDTAGGVISTTTMTTVYEGRFPATSPVCLADRKTSTWSSHSRTLTFTVELREICCLISEAWPAQHFPRLASHN